MLLPELQHRGGRISPCNVNGLIKSAVKWALNGLVDVMFVAIN